MSLSKLVGFFATFTNLPVYAEDVRDQIIDLGIQDQIEFQPIDENPAKLRGMFLRYRLRSGVYGDPENHIVIFYNKNVPPDEQNYICIKELMHVFDDKMKGAVQSEAELAKHLCALFPSAPGSKDASVSAFLDMAAEFLAFVVMFPQESRDAFLSAINEHRMTGQEVSEATGIPMDCMDDLLSTKWDIVLRMLEALKLQ